MDLKAFRIIGPLLLATSAISESKNLSDRELFEIGKKALSKHANAKSDEGKKRAFREVLQDLPDAQKIKAIAYRVLASDDNPKYAMRSSNSMAMAYALGQDPNLIQNWNELGEMIKNEKSPRKFYLLSTLATTKRGAKHNGFIAERTHMLFADGRVAKDEGEYTKSYAHDVSAYAYKAIIGNLKALGADFEPPAKGLPHEEQAVILAKWLKGNWPGCEDIEIPRRLLGEESRPRKSLTEQPKPSTSRIKERGLGVSQEAKPQNEESRLPWIIAGVLLLGILALLFKIFKGKSTS